jgi:hypothetical protein
VTRFAWIQTRTQTVATAAALAALAVVSAYTGIHLAHLYSSLVAHCQASGDCSDATSSYLSHYSFLQHAFNLLPQVVPALLGIFWGAPLIAREFETGTFRLAWTQSVSRSRWLLTKLILGALVTVAIAAVLTLTITWWSRGIDHVQADQYSNFDLENIAPIGYALFAFALGSLAGAVLRRTLSAMVTTLGLFVLVRVAIEEWVRPHLFAPMHLTSSLQDIGGFGFISSNGGPPDVVVDGPSKLPNAWVLSNHLVTATGQPTTVAQRVAFIRQYCPTVGEGPGPGGPGGPAGVALRVRPNPATLNSLNDCRSQMARTFRVLTTYQPANRYWAFQWAEVGIFVALALAAAAGCYWWVVRRSA